MLIDQGTQVNFQDIDRAINSEIRRISEQNSDLWSSPQRDPREFVHSLFQYPAMMVPLVQKTIIDVIVQMCPNISSMWDPFVGAGTTITAGMICGLDCIGQDINPLAVLVSKAKVAFHWENQALREAYTRVLTDARADVSEVIEVDFPNMDKWFHREVSCELSKLRRAIMRQENPSIRQALWATLAETVRRTSNDRTTTYKLHARPIEEIRGRILSPIEIFGELAGPSVDDLTCFKDSLVAAGLIQNNQYTGLSEILLGDTTHMVPVRNNQNVQFDLMVTSPPYGDNTSTITYGQHAYLPLRWIHLADIDPLAEESFLRTTQEIDRRSLGGRKPQELSDLQARLGEQSPILNDVFRRLTDSGQLIDRHERIAAFYRDMIVALDRILPSMAENSFLVWTVGNRRVGGIEIRNDEIITELLANRNVVLVADADRRICFKRMPHKNRIAQMMRSEKILIFRKQPVERGRHGQ